MIRYIVKFFKPLLLYAISITILPGNAYATSEINDQEQIALIRAAKCGNVKTIKHLLDAGYDVNTTDHHGYNLLMQSITADTYDTAEASNYLVKRGADLAQQAYDGTSTLDLAVNFEKMSLSSSIFRGITTDQYFNLADYKPTISFFITDLKFDNKGNIKILEFGEGTRSYFKGHDQLYPKGLIWQRFWKYLGEKNLPVWHIGNLITAAKEADEISIATCKAYGGTLHTSLHILEKEPAFKRVIATARKIGRSLAGIVVLHHHSTNSAMLNYFKTTYPEILIVNEASRSFVNSKFMTNLLFENDPQLAQYRPPCKTYPKIFTPDLVEKIKADFPQHNKLVIKPLNSANGWGVIITTQANLRRELRTILKQRSVLLNSLDTTYTYWLNDTNKHFIVEGFVPSKTIMHENLKFDATMRQVFVIESNSNDINITFLGSYWKLPAMSLNESGSQTERHKSKVKAGRKSSVLVSEEDNVVVQETLRSIMSLIYKKMLQCTYRNGMPKAYPQ